jgi:phosphoribosylformylglycinamidine (FGAM) synthase-like amidotransferase family enzyme
MTVFIIKGDGINCDLEVTAACLECGLTPKLLTTQELIEMHPQEFLQFKDSALILPGGFSFADVGGAGFKWANLLRGILDTHLKPFVEGGGAILGICNGFQVLVRLGFFSDFGEFEFRTNLSWGHDQSEIGFFEKIYGAPKFENRWVPLKLNPGAPSSIWLKRWLEINQKDSKIFLPIRNGEGRLKLMNSRLRGGVQLFYDVSESSDWKGNGSDFEIAALSDKTGRVLGIMPHPEGLIRGEQHPHFQSKEENILWGKELFLSLKDYLAGGEAGADNFKTSSMTFLA